MGSSGSDKVPRDTEMEDSEATIEIKIKTLDSQTYTLRVDKQIPVPALKEQIASVTGVLSEQQRLICRGRVLNDDQILSAYHVEEGHTLHLVARQPVPPPSVSSPNPSGTSRGLSHHVPIVIETYNVPGQWDGNLSDITQDQGSQRLERTSGGSGMPDSSQVQTEQAIITSQSNRSHSAFGLPAAVSSGPLQTPVIPDSLATMSQYLSQLRNQFDALGRAGVNDSQTASMSRTGYRGSNSASNSGTVHEGLPTPLSLAEVLLSTRQLLTEQAGDSLQQLARRLDDQGNVTDPSARLLAQSNALRIGRLLIFLGSLLLELGRTTMSLRLGQSASEAVVNAGPAVFISPFGTNPLTVRVPPFHPRASFGAIPEGTVQPRPGSVNRLGTDFIPRRIDIEIRRGSSVATPNITREEHPSNQSGQMNRLVGSNIENRSTQTTSRISDAQAFARESGVRVIPTRTLVAAVPDPLGCLPSESSGENPSSGAQPEQLPIPESAVQHQSSEESARDGSLPNASSRQLERPNTRSTNISNLAAGRTQNDEDVERLVRSSIFHFLRENYPGVEVEVEEDGSQGTTTDSVRGQAETSSGAPASEPNTTDQGVFLSNLLHQIMPYISQHVGLQQSTTEDAINSTSADNSTTGNS